MAAREKKVEDRITDIQTSLEDYYIQNRIVWDRNILKKKGHWWIEINNRRWQSSRYNYTNLDPRYPTPATDFYFSQSTAIESNIIKGFPIPYARPRVKTEKAKRAARFNDTLLKYYWEELRMRDVIGKVTGWCLDNGGCIGIPGWSMSRGAKIELPTTEEYDDVEAVDVVMCRACGTYSQVGTEICPNEECNKKNGRTDLIPQNMKKSVKKKKVILDEFGNAKTETVRTGDAIMEIAPYYEWLFDPFVDELQDNSFIMRRQAKSLTWMKDIHGKKAEEVSSDVASVESYWYTPRINGWINGGVHINNDQRVYLQHLTEDVAPYVEYWRKPVGDSDKGRYVVMGGNVKLVDEPFPWEDGKYHFIHFRFAKSSGGMYGDSFGNKVIPINDRINRIDQAITWSRQLTTDPIILNPSGSGINNAAFYGTLGRIINHAYDRPPAVLEFSNLAKQAYSAERAESLSDLEKVGVSDPMQGALPQGRTPAYSVEMSIEQSNNKMSQFAFYLSEGIKEWSRELSRLARKNLSGPRKFDIMGENEEYEVQAFSGTDLEGDPSSTDGGILIEHSFDNIYPTSRAAEKQMMIELIQYQAINPQDQFIAAIIMEKFGFDDDVNMPFNADKAAAERETVRMESGEKGIDITAEYGKAAGIKDMSKINMVKGQLMDMTDPQQPQPIDPKMLLKPGENVSIHFEIHRLNIQKESFERLKPEMQEIGKKHFRITAMAHMQQEQQKMMQQAHMAMVSKGSPSPEKLKT